MSDFRFIEQDVILAIHELQLAQHGGGVGVRDLGLLESALARPLNLAAYDPHADIAAIAAAYAFGIAKNHPFIDGNKRTAYVAMELFLLDNGATFTATDEESLLAMLSLASGDMTEQAFAAWIRLHLRT